MKLRSSALNQFKKFTEPTRLAAAPHAGDNLVAPNTPPSSKPSRGLSQPDALLPVG